MIDQMPDEVWLDTYNAGPDNGTAKMQTDVYTPESVILPVCAVRYIRADLHEHTQRERDALADDQRCIACGGTGVDVEYGDYGAQLGSDWCDSCEAGKSLRELDERAERAEAERDDARARVEHLLTEICGGAANRHALAERLREVEAERGRLRAAVSEAKRRIGIYMDDECSYDETLEMGRFVLDAFHGLQEALDHD